MIKIIWASNDFKLTLLSSIFSAGLALFMWYSIRMDFMLRIGLLVGIFPPSQLALRIIIERQLKTQKTSKLNFALLAGVWGFILTFGGYFLAFFIVLPEIIQETKVIVFLLGLGVVFGLDKFRQKWKELKHQAIPNRTTPLSPPAP